MWRRGSWTGTDLGSSSEKYEQSKGTRAFRPAKCAFGKMIVGLRRRPLLCTAMPDDALIVISRQPRTFRPRIPN
jgi:hypothetical protein